MPGMDDGKRRGVAAATPAYQLERGTLQPPRRSRHLTNTVLGWTGITSPPRRTAGRLKTESCRIISIRRCNGIQYAYLTDASGRRRDGAALSGRPAPLPGRHTPHLPLRRTSGYDYCLALPAAYAAPTAIRLDRPACPIRRQPQSTPFNRRLNSLDKLKRTPPDRDGRVATLLK
jgi:hypothetical protein